MRVCEKTMTLLAGRPEQAAAARRLAWLGAEQAWMDGEDLILAGEAARASP